MRARTLLSLLAVLAFAIPAGADVLINEIDCDTSGTDTLEFLELFGDPFTDLTGMVLVLYNGSDDASYQAVDLDGYALDENGFFHIGNTDVVPTPDIIVPSNFIQNGADAAALYYGDDTEFPNDTPVTLVNIIDAVVYGTSDDDDPGLLPLLLAGPQVDENANGNKDFESIFRCPDGGGGAQVTTEFAIGVPTPGASNVPSCGGGPEPTDMALCDIIAMDANGEAVHVGEYVHVIEPLLVLNDYGVFASGRIDNAATDGTCCVYLFDYNQDLPLYEGDELDVIGTVDFYNGKIEISALEITLISSGNPLPSPELITTEELAVNGNDYESCLIQIDDLSIIGGDWPLEGDSANLDIVDETTIPTVLRIDSDTDIDGSDAPVEPFVCTGIGGQYDYSSPYFEGFQLLPRRLEDIEGYLPPPTQACCFDDGTCQELVPDACEAAGGIVFDEEFCDPNPCPPTPAENSSWGEIKSLYR